MKLDEATQKARELEQKLTTERRRARKTDDMMGGGVEPGESERLDDGSVGGVLTADQHDGGKLRLPTPKGRLIKGSTRPLVEVSSTRGKVTGMLSQLDDNNRWEANHLLSCIDVSLKFFCCITGRSSCSVARFDGCASKCISWCRSSAKV